MATGESIRVFGFGRTGLPETWTLTKESITRVYGGVEVYGTQLTKFNPGVGLVAWIECSGLYLNSDSPQWVADLTEAIAAGNVFPDWHITLLRTAYSHLLEQKCPEIKVRKIQPHDRWWDLPAPDAPGFAERAMAAVRASAGDPSHG